MKGYLNDRGVFQHIADKLRSQGSAKVPDDESHLTFPRKGNANREATDSTKWDKRIIATWTFGKPSSAVSSPGSASNGVSSLLVLIASR